MKKITITRALSTIKLLDKKITKGIQKGQFITFKIGQKVQEDITPEADFQSVQDLITERNNLKVAVMLSNSTVDVTIAGKVYKVIEAIERKANIKYDNSLLQALRGQLDSARYRVDSQNEDVQRRLDKLLEASVGKDGKAEDIKAIVEPFEKRNLAVLEDALDIENKIEVLETFIDEFLSEVDLSLSESNATTTIKV